MKKEVNMKKMKKVCTPHHGCSGGMYFFGFLGAAIYYISTAGSFWMGVLGVLKALIWPLFLVFKLLGI